MQYVAFAFAIFGFLAYLELSSLKKRIDELERQLTKMQGTSFMRIGRACCRRRRPISGRK